MDYIKDIITESTLSLCLSLSLSMFPSPNRGGRRKNIKIFVISLITFVMNTLASWNDIAWSSSSVQPTNHTKWKARVMLLAETWALWSLWELNAESISRSESGTGIQDVEWLRMLDQTWNISSLIKALMMMDMFICKKLLRWNLRLIISISDW